MVWGSHPLERGAVMSTSQTPLRDRMTGWAFRGRPFVPTTIEGRLALLMALVSAIPVIGYPAILGAPIMLFLALRRGDRSLLLFVPIGVTILLILLVVAEFTVGHD